MRFTYDAVGNRLSEARNGAATVNYTYNALQQLTQRGTTTYAHDANGNQTAAGTRTFAWNMAGQLVSSTQSGTTVTYTYDGNGNRLTASTGAGASQNTRYSWDINNPLPMLYTEKDGNNSLLRRYMWGHDTISMSTPAGAFYLHYDQIGSTTNLTSATGITQWTRTFEPFGVKRTETKNVPTAPVLPLQYTGENIDLTTGLYNLRARHLDPTSGRFTSYDPLAQPSAVPYSSDYAYVANRPTVWTDPSGMCVFGLPCPPNVKAALEGARDVVVLSLDAVVYAAYPPNWDDIAIGTYNHVRASCPLWTLAVPNACAGILAEQLITGTAEDIWGCLTDNGDIRGKTRQCIKAALQVIGYGKAVRVATRGARAAKPVGRVLSNREAGQIIQWGTSNKPEGVAATMALSKSLTPEDVLAMQSKGLNRRTVENLLEQYNAAITQGGSKLRNTQLIPRRDLMIRILELWPK